MTPTTTAAGRLLTAREQRRPCPPVRDLLGPDDIDAAYAVQTLGVQDRITRGARVVGTKIGLTSPAVQRQFGVCRPDFGVLFADMVYAHAQPVPLDSLLQPRAEGEVAFVLGRDIDVPGATVADVVRATEFVLPAIEIVDSRIAGWDLSITDTVADNASGGAVVLGTTPYSLPGRDLASMRMTLSKNGAQVSTGSGSACLGSPVAAVAWLARELVRRGRSLRAGDIVMSGALGPLVPVDAPCSFRLCLDGMAEVEAVIE